MTVLTDATSDPQPNLKSDDRRLRRFVQNSFIHQLFFFFQEHLDYVGLDSCNVG